MKDNVMKFGVGQFLLLALCLAFASETTLSAPQSDEPSPRTGQDGRGKAGNGAPRDAKAMQVRRRMEATIQKKAADAETKSETTNSKKPEKPPKPAGPISAFVGAEIHTMAAKGVIENGTILVQNGKILAVGDSQLKIPEGATKVDVSGHVLTPGLIDASSKLWLNSAASRSSASDGSLNALHGIDPFSDTWNEIVSAGITSVYIQPAGSMGGYGAVVSVAPNSDSAGPEVIKSFAALQASIGNVPDNRARKSQFDRTLKVFQAALDYKKQWETYRKYQAEQEKKKKETSKAKEGSKTSDKAKASASASSAGRRPTGRPPTGRVAVDRTGRPVRVPGGRPMTGSSDAKPSSASNSTATKPDAKTEEEKKPPKKPEKDPAKDRLLEVLEGKIPLRLEVKTADDVHFAMQLVKKHADLQIVYQGLSALRSSAQDILSTGSPLVYGPWLGLDSPLDEDEESTKWIRELIEYEGAQAIATYASTAQGSKLLRAHAARAISAGMPADKALRSISIDAARLLGVGTSLGSIEKGKRADFACFTGNPLATANAAKLVVSSGKVVFKSTASSSSASLATHRSEPSLPTRSKLALKGQVLQKDGSLVTQIIVIEDGKIASIANGDSDLDDLEIVDLQTAVITPGLFSAHSNFQQQSNLDPSSTPDASFVSVVDSIAPAFQSSEKLAKSGVLRAAIAPGSGNPLAGSTSVVRLGLQTDSTSEFVTSQNSASKFVLASTARSTSRFPSSLAGQLQLINSSLDGALLPDRLYLPEPIADRLQKSREAAMQRIATGGAIAIFESQTDAEISAALKLIARRNLKAALLAPTQLTPFIERLIATQTAVICKPTSASAYNWYEQDIAAAANAGVKILFSGESDEALRLTAARAVAAGMSLEAANASLCYGGDELFGTQSMQKGLPADIVVWSDLPTNLSAQPVLVLVDGKEVN